jgi:hypothetical protein
LHKHSNSPVLSVSPIYPASFQGPEKQIVWPAPLPVKAFDLAGDHLIVLAQLAQKRRPPLMSQGPFPRWRLFENDFVVSVLSGTGTVVGNLDDPQDSRPGLIAFGNHFYRASDHRLFLV